MAISFDFPNSHIDLSGAEATAVTVQELCDAIAAAEESWEGLEYDQIAEMEGKVDRGGSIYSGIQLKLLGNWQIDLPVDSGQCIISGGDVVKESGAIFVDVAGTNPVLVQDGGGIIATQTIDSGSGLSPTQSDYLYRLWQRFIEGFSVDDDNNQIAFGDKTQTVSTVGNKTTVTLDP